MAIGLFVTTAMGSLFVALLVTWFAWELWIPERAFHCTDDGLSIAFWTSADTHWTAGDKILPGWTWEKLSLVNNMYEFAFFALWIGGTVALFRIFHTILQEVTDWDMVERVARREPSAEPCAPPNGGSAKPLGNSGVPEGPPSVS